MCTDGNRGQGTSGCTLMGHEHQHRRDAHTRWQTWAHVPCELLKYRGSPCLEPTRAGPIPCTGTHRRALQGVKKDRTAVCEQNTRIHTWTDLQVLVCLSMALSLSLRPQPSTPAAHAATATPEASGTGSGSPLSVAPMLSRPFGPSWTQAWRLMWEVGGLA